MLCGLRPPSVRAETDFSDEQKLACSACPCLLAPDSLVQTIASDLELIRTAYPAVEAIRFQRCNYLLPGEVEVLLTADARAAFLAGEHEGLNALHDQLGTPEIIDGPFDFLCLSFALPYKPELLHELYAEIDGVQIADVVWSCVGDGDGIELRADGAYVFRRAWGEDCLNGCGLEHIWIFAVSGDQVALVSEYGDQVAVGAPSWGSIKARFLQSAPAAPGR